MTLLAFMTIRRRAWRRTFLVWAGTSWFACPEWSAAYLYPKIPLTDLIEEENYEKELTRVVNEMQAQDQILIDAEPGKVVERISELKKEADQLIQEKQELAQ